MIYKIIERIIAYSLAQGKPVKCVRFGQAKGLTPPYVVVKQERDSGGAGAAFRIISHFPPGMDEALSIYNRTTIGQALDGFDATSSSGSYNFLNSDYNSFDGSINAMNDDGTISSERLYYMGDRI